MKFTDGACFIHMFEIAQCPSSFYFLLAFSAEEKGHLVEIPIDSCSTEINKKKVFQLKISCNAKT